MKFLRGFSCLTLIVLLCFNNVEPLINSKIAKEHEYSHHACIYKRGIYHSFFPTDGAAVYKGRYLITSASCIEKGNPDDPTIETLEDHHVHMGYNKLENYMLYNPEVMITKVVVHPDYKEKNISSIAIIQIERDIHEIEYSDPKKPKRRVKIIEEVRLPTADAENIDYKEYTVTGYGNIEKREHPYQSVELRYLKPKSNTLKRALCHYTSPEHKRHNDTKFIERLKSGAFVCTQNPAGTYMGNMFDDGDPLVYYQTINGKEVAILEGVYFKDQEDYEEKPVYIKIFPLVPWIEEEIAKMEKERTKGKIAKSASTLLKKMLGKDKDKDNDKSNAKGKEPAKK